MRIRIEGEKDGATVRDILSAAFETRAEADLVDALKRTEGDLISLVAEEESAVVGHILFSPVSLSRDAEFRAMGLAPVAVYPRRQRCGVGTALIRTGLERCRREGYRAVVVLGHPEYYPRFGFRRASRFGLACEYEVPDEAFMALELESGALDGKSGTVRYAKAFRSL